MTDQPLHQVLLAAACSLINCSSRDFDGRIEHILELLCQHQVADHCWLISVGFGSDAPREATRVWRTRAAPRLRSAQRATIHQQCSGFRSQASPRFAALAIGGETGLPEQHCALAMALVCSPCGALVLGWRDASAETIAAAQHREQLAQISSAVVERWQRERYRRKAGADTSISGSNELSDISLPSSMSSAMMAAIGTDPHNKPPAPSELGNQELLRAFALFEVINQGAEDIIAIHDTAGRCLYVNDACSSVLGYAPDQLLGTTTFAITHPDDHGALQEAMAAMVDHGVSNRFEIRVRDSYGRWRWMEGRNGSVRSEQGTFSEIVVILRDIGDRHDFEQVLNFSEQNLRAILDNVPDAAWLKDDQGRFLVTNPAAEHLFGAEADELIGRTEGEFLGIADAHRSLEYDQMVLLSGQGVSYTHHLGREGCDEAILEVRKEPVLDEHENVIGICGYAQDATRTVQIQLDLIRASLLMSHTEQVANVGIWSIQAASRELYWNERMFDLCGFPDKAFQPSLETFVQMIDQSQRTQVLAAIDEALELRRPFRLDLTIQRCDDKPLQAVLVGAPFQDGRGNIRDIAGVMVETYNRVDNSPSIST